MHRLNWRPSASARLWRFQKLYAQLRPQVLPYTYPLLNIHGTADVSGILVTQGIFIALLVLVCLNIAILVYTRTAMRQAEIGLRTALGASRSRIVTQLFIEAFVLSIVAALAGVAIAALGIRQIAAATLPIASEMPFWISLRLLPEAVLYAVALSVFAAAIVGIVPALQATGRELQNGLRVAGASGLRLGKTWTVLIIAQVSFAVALLPPAVSSSWEDMRDGFAGLGFEAEEFLSAQLGMDSVPGATAAAGTPEFTRRLASRQTELIRRLEEEPRVSGVTFAMVNPGNETNARIEAQGVASERVHEVRLNRVDVDYFRVFEVPILAGRGLGQGDIDEESPGGRAVVVNLPFAQKVFGGNALGKRIRYVDSEALVRDRRYRQRFSHWCQPGNARPQSSQGVPRDRGRPAAARGDGDSDARRLSIYVYPAPAGNRVSGRSRPLFAQHKRARRGFAQ